MGRSAGPLRLSDISPMDPDTMELPLHILAEARALAAATKSDNPLTELAARPLVRSTAIWLMVNGTVNKEDSPGVIQKAGDLLHEIIQLHMCQVPSKKVKALDFASRIFNYLQCHVTRQGADFRIQVAHDAQLNTPMRILERENLVHRLVEGEVPAQGHDAKSIIGKKRSFKGDEEETAEEAPAEGAPAPAEGAPAPAEGAPAPTPAPSSARAPAPAPAPASSASSTATPVPYTVMMFEHLTKSGLDVRIAPASRSAGTANLPEPQSLPPNERGDQPPPPDGGGRGRGRGRGRSKPPAPKPPASEPPAPKPPASKPPASKLPAPKPPARKPPASKHPASKPPAAALAAAPSVAWSASTPAKTYEAHEDELRPGMLFAYFMALPDHMGGPDWYKGTVTRLSRNKWADVDFEDGKAWCRVLPAERGLRWVALAETEETALAATEEPALTATEEPALAETEEPALAATL